MTAKLAANFTTALVTLRDRKETGATALEYVGMILVAALVVGAVWGAIKNQGIDEKVATAVTKILTGG